MGKCGMSTRFRGVPFNENPKCPLCITSVPHKKAKIA